MSVQPISVIASKLGINEEHLIPYGKYKAKVDFGKWDEEKIGNSKLILVTSITPTKAGNGKTTVTIGLGDGLRQIGKNAVLALREPSMGPVFGKKGGGTGGGKSQLFPANEINLHFTGDFHALTSANNLLAAIIDNYRFFNQNTEKEIGEVYWRRVLDVNDRALRSIVTGLQNDGNAIPSGFDITAASELMAILCLAENKEDLRSRIDKITLGIYSDSTFVTPQSLHVSGSVMALLNDALMPNLVQTLEGTPAFVHGGPFANIAHGCNSVVATKAAMQLGDYVITEAGFASDLGAEKFFDIKCRLAGLNPALSVLVVTIQSLKLHGGLCEKELATSDLNSMKAGFKNLQRHIDILSAFNQNILVALNIFHTDTEEEIEFIRNWCSEKEIEFAPCSSFVNGDTGAIELAEKVVAMTKEEPSALKFAYELSDSIEIKLTKLVTDIYGGQGVVFSDKAKAVLKIIDRLQLNNLPVCVAKTQYSFTDNPKEKNTTGTFLIHIDDLVINSGAGFIVAICGEIMRMPGLPKSPNAFRVDVVDGAITGLV